MPVPEITLVPAGRQLTFAAHPADRAHLFRRVGGSAGPWQRVAVHAASPFVDEDVLAPGTRVEYYVHVHAAAADGTSRDRSHLLAITT